MASKTSKQLPHEKRKGEAALSEFAEYVEKQQLLRYPKATPASAGAPADDEHHAELDDILDALDLSDTAPRVCLRELLLSADSDVTALERLAAVLSERIEADHGEFVFGLGFEDSGDGMRLSRTEWDTAVARLAAAAKSVRAECQLLLTKGVGGPLEAESSIGKEDKEKWCSGKALIRQAPASVEKVIETRIAVVGNGESWRQLCPNHWALAC